MFTGVEIVALCREQQNLMIIEFLSLLKKKLFVISSQVSNDCKQCVYFKMATLKNRKTRLDFASKPAQFRSKINLKEKNVEEGLMI